MSIYNSAVAAAAADKGIFWATSSFIAALQCDILNK